MCPDASSMKTDPYGRFNRFAQGIYITLPYTLSVFMVRSFEGSSASEDEIGRNTGMLVCIL